MRNLLDNIIYFVGSAWLIYLAIWIVCAVLDILSRKKCDAALAARCAARGSAAARRTTPPCHANRTER